MDVVQGRAEIPRYEAREMKWKWPKESFPMTAVLMLRANNNDKGGMHYYESITYMWILLLMQFIHPCVSGSANAGLLMCIKEC